MKRTTVLEFLKFIMHSVENETPFDQIIVPHKG